VHHSKKNQNLGQVVVVEPGFVGFAGVVGFVGLGVSTKKEFCFRTLFFLAVSVAVAAFAFVVDVAVVAVVQALAVFAFVVVVRVVVDVAVPAVFAVVVAEGVVVCVAPPQDGSAGSEQRGKRKGQLWMSAVPLAAAFAAAVLVAAGIAAESVG